MKHLHLLLPLLLLSCDAISDDPPEGGPDGDTPADATEPDGTADGDGLADAAAADSAIPSELRLRPYMVNIIDAEANGALGRFLSQGQGLDVAARRFYDFFEDEYDFIYLFPDVEIVQGPAAEFHSVHQPDIPEIGLRGQVSDPAFGSPARLRGAIAMNPFSAGNGPTIHETLHAWSMFLDRDRFGFGRDADNDFGAHWGPAGIYGQHGGFDPATLRCLEADCPVQENGTIRYVTGPFDATANGGDSVPLAPIELYLMGLLPASEVPTPIPVLRDAHFLMFDMAAEAMHFEATGIAQVEVAEILAHHGKRPLTPDDERIFRAAFVLFSDRPASTEEMDRIERWAKVFAGVSESDFLISFSEATGGRATMDARIGALRP